MNRVKGWCPSAHAPMTSGDGLLVRVKPWTARLTSDEAFKLCDLATRFGSGLIDVTSRANLQLRGVAEDAHAPLLAELIAAGLVSPDPNHEARNMTVTPFWQGGDLTDRLAKQLERIDLPDLPDKMGIVLDTGDAPVLTDTSGDFRLEQIDGQLILRADGADKGRAITEAQASVALCEMSEWFVATGGANSGRMARHIEHSTLPEAWQDVAAAHQTGMPTAHFGSVGPEAIPQELIAYGIPFGQTTAQALKSLLRQSVGTHVRITPWRVIILDNARYVETQDFLAPDHPRLAVAACPGAPHCAQATVVTRDLARDLSATISNTLHVSGCAKGCARPSAAAMTLVGRDGRFDLVRNGRAGDTPVESGLTAAEARLLEV